MSNIQVALFLAVLALALNVVTLYLFAIYGLRDSDGTIPEVRIPLRGHLSDSKTLSPGILRYTPGEIEQGLRERQDLEEDALNGRRVVYRGK